MGAARSSLTAASASSRAASSKRRSKCKVHAWLPRSRASSGDSFTRREKIGSPTAGDSIRATDLFGAPMVDDTFFVVVNAINLANVKAFGDMFRGKQKPDFKSPIYIVRIMKEQLSRGAAEGLQFVAMISTLLGFFNLMPLPALDGGRLVFLGWELVTRRPVNQRVEQIVHLVGMVLLLGLLLLLVVKDLRDWIFGH